VGVPDSDHANPAHFEGTGPGNVISVLLQRVVVPAVQLDREVQLRTVEVHDEAGDGVLATELETEEARSRRRR